MGKNRRVWAVTTSEDGKPQFHRFTNGPCPTCGLKECLPHAPHGPGQFYHVGTGRFLTLDEVEASQGNGSSQLEPGLPEGFRSLGAYERHLEREQGEQKRKNREYVRRHRERKRLARSRM